MGVIYWLEPPPVLTGALHDWTHFSADLSYLTWELGYSDTLLYKFSFISDDIQTYKEGWIIDDFLFEDFWEGIGEHHNDNLISIYPNPASDRIYFQFSSNSHQLGREINMEIYNLIGEKVGEGQIPSGRELFSYNVSKLSDGIYLAIFKENQRMIGIGKFVIAR